MLHTKKTLIPTLLLASLFSSQNAFAVSSYSADASFSYTISATNLNASGNLDALDIDENDGFFLDAMYESETSSTTDNYGSSFFEDLDVKYTHQFHAEDSIDAEGSIDVVKAKSEYYWEYYLAFENFSSNAADQYEVTIELSYELNAIASGQNADIESYYEIYTSNEDLVGADDAAASTNLQASQTIANTDSITFILDSDTIKKFYFEYGIEGNLEASPVPVPAAIWLFGSALLGLTGIRKVKATS